MKTIAAAAALAGSFLFVGASSAATFYTEDFSGYSPATIARDAHTAGSTSGNTITTDYNYRVPNGQNHNGQLNSMYDEGTWTIGTNPFAVHDLWVNQSGPDGNPANEFLMLNGAVTDPANPPETAWESQLIAVGPGSYTYSYDLLNLCCNVNGPPGIESFLQLEYFGPTGFVTPTAINTTVHTDTASNGWTHVSGNFAVGGSGGFIRLALTDTTTVASGNDFGVDNVSLASAPEPASWALMILGFGGLGVSLRRRRAALA